jgi:hypothetical protein
MNKLDCTTDLIQHAIGSEVLGGEEESAPPRLRAHLQWRAVGEPLESRLRAVREPLESH